MLINKKEEHFNFIPINCNSFIDSLYDTIEPMKEDRKKIFYCIKEIEDIKKGIGGIKNSINMFKESANEFMSNQMEINKINNKKAESNNENHSKILTEINNLKEIIKKQKDTNVKLLFNLLDKSMGEILSKHIFVPIGQEWSKKCFTEYELKIENKTYTVKSSTIYGYNDGQKI